MSFKKVIVGSRASELALIQTRSVIEKLKIFHEKTTFEIKKVTTIGDKILNQALSEIGEKSLFTKELEVELLNENVDFVVHSLKDLPTILPQGLCIAAICQRENPYDAVILRSDLHLQAKEEKVKDVLEWLPKNSLVGTSSLRRAAQIMRNYPHLKVMNIRGNLNTRLKKLETEDENANKFAAIILAVAGIERINWKEKISQVLTSEQCMYAVGQGALAMECLSSREDVIGLLKGLHNHKTALECVAERMMMTVLEGGCHAPIATFSCSGPTEIKLKGAVLSLDGQQMIISEESMSKLGKSTTKSFTSIKPHEVLDFETAAELGKVVAENLIKQGAKSLMQSEN